MCTTKICSWQSWFRPQNHSGEAFLVNSFSAPGRLETALLEIRWSLAEARGRRLGGSGPLPTLGRGSPRLWGRRRLRSRWGPGLWTRRGCSGECGWASLTALSIRWTYYVLITSAQNSHFLEGQREIAQGRLAHSVPSAPRRAQIQGSGRAPRLRPRRWLPGL